MAVQTLALVYDTGTKRVTQSGLTGDAVPVAVAKTLSTLGIIFEPRAVEGRIADTTTFDARRRAEIITIFNGKFGQPRNRTLPKADSARDINEGAEYAAADTGLTVDTNTTPFAALDYIMIDDELLQVTGIATPTLTVVRGVHGTVDVAHDDGTDVYIVATYALTLTSV